jgi:hypothetical protein
MLLQTTSFFNLIEASPDAIYALLRHLDTLSKADSPLVTDLKVISAVDDCPRRAFQSWSYRSPSLAPEAGFSLEGEDVLEAGFQLYSKLVAVGQQLTDADLTQETLGTALDTLKQRFADYLPSDERVRAFAVHPKTKAVAAFLRVYDAPIAVKLPSTQAKPLPFPAVY